MQAGSGAGWKKNYAGSKRGEQGRASTTEIIAIVRDSELGKTAAQDGKQFGWRCNPDSANCFSVQWAKMPFVA